MTLTKLKNISLVLVIVTITGFDAYFFDALNRTFGIPYLYYTYLYLFIIPGMLLINNGLQKRRFQTPNLFYFLFFIGSYYYVETNMHGAYYEPDYDLIRRVSPLFFAYIAMVNFGSKFEDYLRVLKVSLGVILLTTSLFYLGFLGLIDTGKLSTFDDGRTISSWNLNTISDMNVLGIFIAYVIYTYKGKIMLFNFKVKPIILVFYFLIILLFTATRGSILLFIIGGLVYFRMNIKNISVSKKFMYSVLILLVTIFFVAVDFLGVLSNNIFVFDRLLNSTYEEEGRYLQIIASWKNFTENVWYGVGYSRAADNHFDGIIRSNFQYTQILGAGGLILFITYFTFIFKMFLGRLKNRSNLIILAMLMFVLVSFIFRRIEMYYAILAYIVFIETQLMKTRQT